MQIEIPKGYESLGAVLQMAVMQAAFGKGKERHACGEPFEQQKICRISRSVGSGFAIGQAMKKAEEAPRLGLAGVDELLGAINYAAAGCIVLSEELGDPVLAALVDPEGESGQEDPLQAAQGDLEKFLAPEAKLGRLINAAETRRRAYQKELCDD